MFEARRGTFWIMIAALVATAAKLYCALTTLGAEDVLIFYQLGRIVDSRGFASLMELRTYNHTPLVASYPAALVHLIRGNEEWFPFFIKLPGILAYLGTVGAMMWLKRRIPEIPTYALVLFAASPISFMIDGFHGNVDSVMVFPLVLAACACALPRPSWILCAVFLALACQVKIIPLLMAPVFWFFWIHRGRGLQFLLVTGAAVILGWLPGLLANPTVFLKQVVGYGSIWGLWGITHLLYLTGIPAFARMHWFDLSDAQLAVSQILKLVIIAGVMVAAWRNRKGDATVLFSTLAFCWTLFFAFAPGLGVQYMVWFAPFLLVWNARWYTALTTVTATVLFVFYQAACGTFPWYRTDSPSAVKYLTIFLLPWVAFLACTVVFLIKRTSGSLNAKVVEVDTTIPRSRAAIEDAAPVS